MMALEIIIGIVELVLLAIVTVSAYMVVILMMDVTEREATVVDREESLEWTERETAFTIQSRLAEEFQKGWNARDAAYGGS